MKNIIPILLLCILIFSCGKDTETNPEKSLITDIELSGKLTTIDLSMTSRTLVL